MNFHVADCWWSWVPYSKRIRRKRNHHRKNERLPKGSFHFQKLKRLNDLLEVMFDPIPINSRAYIVIPFILNTVFTWLITDYSRTQWFTGGWGRRRRTRGQMGSTPSQTLPASTLSMWTRSWQNDWNMKTNILTTKLFKTCDMLSLESQRAWLGEQLLEFSLELLR